MDATKRTPTQPTVIAIVEQTADETYRWLCALTKVCWFSAIGATVIAFWVGIMKVALNVYVL